MAWMAITECVRPSEWAVLVGWWFTFTFCGFPCPSLWLWYSHNQSRDKSKVHLRDHSYVNATRRNKTIKCTRSRGPFRETELMGIPWIGQLHRRRWIYYKPYSLLQLRFISYDRVVFEKEVRTDLSRALKSQRMFLSWRRQLLLGILISSRPDEWSEVRWKLDYRRIIYLELTL